MEILVVMIVIVLIVGTLLVFSFIYSECRKNRPVSYSDMPKSPRLLQARAAVYARLRSDGPPTEYRDHEIKPGEYIESEFFCDLAGARYNNISSQVGGYFGYAVSEPDNPFDRNAVGIYRSDFKLVGHIPRVELRDYSRFSKGEPLPCVFFIKEGDVCLFGKVKVTNDYGEDARNQLSRFADWIERTFGPRYAVRFPDLHEQVSGGDDIVP